jgi:PKD repeat protein
MIFLISNHMKHFKLISFFSIIVLLVSCREKKLPEDIIEDNTPVFTLSANIDGIPINIAAGSNNYYLYSNYDLGPNTNPNGGPSQFVGALKQNNCTLCPNSLEIQFINNYAFNNLGTNYIDTVLKQSNAYMYVKDNSNVSSYNVKFKATPRISLGGNITGYLWEFGDGTISSDINPTHAYSSAGAYNVSLTIYSDNFGSSKVTNQVKIGLANNVCQSKIVKDFWLAPNKIKFYKKNTGVAPFQYTWDFGDGSTSIDSTPSHQYTGSPSKYKVKLKVIDANADTAYSEYNTKMDAAAVVLSNFVVESTIENPLKSSRVIVNWIDANGVVYTSKHSSQPNASNFEIVSTENYVVNENGQPTKKVHVKFNCKVYNGLQSLSMSNVDVIIAVAYK